jgi:dihydrofolate reductase
MSNRPWKAIAAMSENRVIGNANRIPWHLPEDFKWVKACTRGKAIAMGRKTFESMGRPLPDRENIVISRTATDIPGCTVLPSLEALETYDTEREIWIFGGSQIYTAAMDRIGELYLTVVNGTYEGDAFFPPFEDQFEDPEIVREADGFRILKYVHKA